MQRLGTINPQGRPLRLAEVDPGQQVAEFLLCGGNLRRRLSRHSFGFGDIAPQVPDPLAIGCRMSGDGDARLRPATQAMGVQGFEARALDQNHVQRSNLHGRLAQAEGREQFGIAGTGTEDDALRTDFPLVDPQADQFAVFQQGFDLLPGQQSVAGQFGQACDQARYIDDQFGQAIDLALEALVLQGGG
ncbi:hypothetical protein D3C73_1252000 [compost metagenome]